MSSRRTRERAGASTLVGFKSISDADRTWCFLLSSRVAFMFDMLNSVDLHAQSLRACALEALIAAAIRLIAAARRPLSACCALRSLPPSLFCAVGTSRLTLTQQGLDACSRDRGHVRASPSCISSLLIHASDCYWGKKESGVSAIWKEGDERKKVIDEKISKSAPGRLPVADR